MPAMKQPTPPNPFGTTENKSAASLVTEAKTAATGDDTEETDMARPTAPLTPPDADTTPDPDALAAAPLDPPAADDQEPETEAPAEQEKVEVELIQHLNVQGPSGVPVAHLPEARLKFPAALAETLVRSKVAKYPDSDEA